MPKIFNEYCLPGYFFTTVVLTACALPKNKAGEIPDRYDEHADATQQVSKTDAFVNIGFVRKFDNTQELYTDLYFREDFDVNAYDRLVSSGDSIILDDDFVKRTRIPLHVAQHAFDLALIDQIEVYTPHHLSKGWYTLQRVEYLQDIEGSFVAIYGRDHTGSNPLYYMTSNSFSRNENFVVTQIASPDLAFSYPVDSGVVSMVHQYKIFPHNFSLILLSADTTSYILKVNETGTNLVYQSEWSENIFRLTVLPAEANHHPLILTEAGKPETDMMWSALLYFEAGKYVVAPRSLLKRE